MRAGISLPERFSETINISRDRGWDSKKKALQNILYGKLLPSDENFNSPFMYF